MASATTTPPSSLMLTYAASSIHLQDLTTPSLSFKPKFRTFSLYPLVLQRRQRITSTWVDSSSPSSSSSLTRESKASYDSVVVAAVAAEAELDESLDEKEGELGGGDAVPASKPKKGKAALLLKRDRVCFDFFSFFGVLLLVK